MADGTARPPLVISDGRRRPGEVPEVWRKANITPIFKQVKKEDPENHGPVTLTVSPGKVVEQLLLETISRHKNDKKDPQEKPARLH